MGLADDYAKQEYGNEVFEATWPHPHVLHIAMNRGPVNACNDAFWVELGRNFRKARYDPQCRVVVLSSKLEKVFTVGLDLHSGSLDLKGADPARSAVLMRNHILEFQDAISAIQDCDKPVVVACHGVAYGLAVDIISAADVRFAAVSTRFSIKEVDVGLAADLGTLQRLPKVTGNNSLLRELALTAREFGAQEAVELGLIAKHQVVQGGREETVRTAEEVAALIATKSPIATMSTKHLLNYSRDHPVKEGLEYTAAWNAWGLQTEDLPLSMQASLSKGRMKPHFKPITKL